jgi:catechol 2,3-dioxygenase
MHDSLAHAPGRLPPGLELGPVELTTGDASRSATFYERVLGMTTRERDGATLTLGTPTRELLRLRELPGAPPAPDHAAGLYHVALLLPGRIDLARWVRHIAGIGLRVGRSDHLVSEAFYLSDPDGHGIEVYRDRPRSEWGWDGGQVRMANDPIDIPGLLAQPGSERPFDVLPADTRIGHVHLQVTSLPTTERFYRDVLGFDIVARWPGALFVSAGGYHHHVGLNTWQSDGGPSAPEGSARLERVHVTLPRDADLDALAGRLQAAGFAAERTSGAIDTRDPSGIALRFSVAPAPASGD